MESYIHGSTTTRVAASLISTLAFDIYTVRSSIMKYIEKIVNTTKTHAVSGFASVSTLHSTNTNAFVGSLRL